MSAKKVVCPNCGESFIIPNIHMVKCPKVNIEPLDEIVRPGFCKECGEYTVFRSTGICNICGKSG